VTTARYFQRDARRYTPTLMIFIDDLENIVEPNQVLAQKNKCSTSHVRNGSHDFQGIVQKRFDKQTIQLYLFSFLFPFLCSMLQ
jgi:hypothetical protein